MPRSVVTYVSAGAMFLLASYATHPTAESPQADPSPTFYRDVLPILQKNCQSCHRPGQIAPFSLLTYESARPGARSRGKDTTYTLVYLDGRQELVLNVPRYDSNWQLGYNLAKPVNVTKGTKLIVNAHFDNSPGSSIRIRTERCTWGR
jgi:hypothetical protein